MEPLIIERPATRKWSVATLFSRLVETGRKKFQGAENPAAK